MNHPVIYGILALALAVVASMMWRLRRKVKRKKAELAAFEGEEARMFEFLRNLGAAIGQDAGRTGLYRTIVDGLDEVVVARGGALYLLDERGDMLQPKYLSENCPALIGVPLEVRCQAEEDPRAMESYLRLSQVPADEGVLGSALSAGRALRIDDLRSHESFRDALLGFGGGEVAALVAPLRHAGRDLGVLAVARLREDGPFTPNDFSVFRSAAEQSGFALGNALVWQEADERRHFETEIRNAREVQRVLLPKGDAEVPGFRISSTNLPARLISGDYHDHLELGGGRHGIVIADVSGKGVPAGLMMAMCRSVLRCHAGLHEDPAALIAAVNRQLFPDIREDMFISLFYGVLTENENRVRLVRAGHDPLLWFRAASGEVEEIKPRGLALGIDPGRVFERVTQVVEIEVAPGDCLLFHTDGVKEAVDDHDGEFGMERLRESFRAHARLGAEAVIEGVQRDLKEFCGGAPQMDDVTLVAIERR